MQLAHGARDILHAHHPDTREVLRSIGDHPGDLIIHDIGKELRVIGRQPVRQKLRHRRQHLHVGAIFDHVGKAPVDVPGACIDFTEHLAADYHRGVVAC